MESVKGDVRQTLRMMGAQKSFTAAAVLTLALGIGANTAIFSMVYGVLFRPLPYAEPERLMRVYEEHPGGTPLLPEARLSDLTLEVWAPTSKTIEGVATFGHGPFTIGSDNPLRVRGGIVSPSLFRLLRVQPVIGRFFHEHEATEGADDVVVIGYGLWQELYGGSAAAVGQTLLMNGRRSRTIIGVAPRGFAFPDIDTAFWVPEVIPAKPTDLSQQRMSLLQVIARLKPNVTPEQAAAEATAAARGIARPVVADTLFGKGGPVEVRVRPVVDEMTTTVRPALLLLMAGVALVLLVACANVANLLLARGWARRREMAVRSALGASLGRLAQQLITESFVFAIAGGILGICLAWILIRVLPAVAPADFPRLASIELDWRVLTFGFVVSLFAGVLAGVLPALRGARPAINPVLRANDRHITGPSGHVLRASLLVVEAALAAILLVSAGLLVRSFIRLTQVDGGFDPSNLLAAQVSLPEWNQRDAKPTAFFDMLLPRLAEIPGVTAVGAGNMAPFGTEAYVTTFDLPTPGANGEIRQARATRWVVTPGYGAALGLRVTSGRFLEPGDVTAPTTRMVVNEEFVRRYLESGKPAVGTQWRRAKEGSTPTEIIGVVANVLKDGLDRQPEPEVYQPASYRTSAPPPFVSLLVRTTSDPLTLVPEFRRLVRETDSRAALDAVGSLSGRVSASVAQPRFAAWMLTLFAGLALIVAATGLYGVLSYGVTERRQEMGVRAALGATRAQLVRLVLSQGLAFSVVGLGLGLIAAAATSRLLSTLLFGVTPYDHVTYMAASVTLILVVLPACLVPAWRAAATDPAEALRAE